jgi:hypothetical protein
MARRGGGGSGQVRQPAVAELTRAKIKWGVGVEKGSPHGGGWQPTQGGPAGEHGGNGSGNTQRPARLNFGQGKNGGADRWVRGHSAPV